jgi:hypothetical protein
MKTAARVTGMEFSADGRLLITAESEPKSPGMESLVRGTVRIWDTATALSCGRPIPAACTLHAFFGYRHFVGDQAKRGDV